MVAIALMVVAAIIPVAIVFSRGTASKSDGFKLHVNPADPIIMTAETSDGETIYMLGNKTSDGIPQSIDELHVESEEGTTYVTMGTDGSVASAVNTDGLQLNFIWAENMTLLHASFVSGNGSQQVSINIDLTEPIGENFTDFEDINVRRKRNTKNEKHLQQESASESEQYMQWTKSVRTERQSVNQNFANVDISVNSCNQPENNARVFADVLLDYDEDTRTHGRSMRYTGMKTQSPGQYQVHIPTSRESDIGDKAGGICDKIEMILGNVCEAYSNVNDLVKIFSRHEADSIICFALGNGLKIAFPALRLIPIYRFCKTAFKGLKTYCNNFNKDLSGDGLTPANLICDALPLVDNGIDYLQEKNLLFTPSAVFPRGNTVTTPGRILRIPPGSSTVNERISVENDQNELRITRFDLFPFDPAPNQDYVAIVTYECYSDNLFLNMSIIGTDDYRDSALCQTGPSCILHVPGAIALVQDTVTVTAQDASTTIVRKVIIIF